MPDNNALAYLTDDGGESYNRCHCKHLLPSHTVSVISFALSKVWSNFEVADLDFFRSPAYLSFFSHLDSAGGFFYERWGDAPVHSIGAALLLPARQIHYFSDIGYYHVPFWNCPDEPVSSELKCTCRRGQSFDATGSGCLRNFEGLFPDGVVG